MKSNQEYIDDTSDSGYYARFTNLKVSTIERGVRLTDSQEVVAELLGKKGVTVDFDEDAKSGTIELVYDEVCELIDPYLPRVTVTVDESTGLVMDVAKDGVATNFNIKTDLSFWKTFVEVNAPVKKITGAEGKGIIVDDSDREAILSLDENYTIDQGEYTV